MMATIFEPQHTRFEDRSLIPVILVSPDARVRESLREKLRLPNWRVMEAAGGAETLSVLRENAMEDGIVVLDPSLHDLDADEFHGMLLERFPLIEVLFMNSQTGQVLVGSVSPTPVSRRLVDTVNQAGLLQPPVLQVVPDRPAEEAERPVRLRSMVGDSGSLMRAFALTRMVAARDTTVLVTGESGTGKDMIAQEIHLISARRHRPFVVVNCSAIPEALLEAELFGYTKGAFTGAMQARIGRIHAAHGGTLFMDEIGDMPLSLQSKILRFLEQGEVQRLGGNDNLKVDVRVVAATNADLKKKIVEQQFREDLYYRLAVFPIHLPPLRERSGDIDELVLAFVARFLPGGTLSRETLEILRRHHWPGNVRELRNAIERASILVGGGKEIRPEHIVL